MGVRLTPANRGFSRLDLIILIAAAVGIGMVILPRFARTHCQSPRISCSNNLKQVGLAFRLWAGDNNDLYPMRVSVTNGGAMEVVLGGNVAAVFQVMSNELNTPKILFCPADKGRAQATTFTSNTKQSFGSSNLSYFIGLDASQDLPGTFLAGDDNLLVGGTQISPHRGAAPKPGILSLRTNDPVTWSTARHDKAGNIGLADGSVQGFAMAGLRKALTESGLTTNRLAMP